MYQGLWSDGENAFRGEGALGPVRCSETFRWFLGGWMKHLPDLMVFYAPNVNSYKRFQDASWAPTHIAWSRDNRTAAFRVVGAGSSLRIECRVPPVRGVDPAVDARRLTPARAGRARLGQARMGQEAL